MKRAWFLGVLGVLLAVAGIARTSAYFTDTVHLGASFVAEIPEVTVSPSVTPPTSATVTNTPTPIQTATPTNTPVVAEETEVPESTHVPEPTKTAQPTRTATRVPISTSTPAPLPATPTRTAEPARTAASTRTAAPTRTVGPTRTAVPTPTPWIPGYNNCGDVTGDGRVTLHDVNIEALMLRLGIHSARYDVNRDGKADYWDLLLIINELGTSCHRTTEITGTAEPSRTATPTRTPVATPTPSIPEYNNCGDVTGDGRVTLHDVNIEALMLRLGIHSARYDVNRDGKADYWDLLLVINELGTSCRR